jgi:hypothetical protein
MKKELSVVKLCEEKNGSSGPGADVDNILNGALRTEVVRLELRPKWWEGSNFATKDKSSMPSPYF